MYYIVYMHGNLQHAKLWSLCREKAIHAVVQIWNYTIDIELPDTVWESVTNMKMNKTFYHKECKFEFSIVKHKRK